MSSAVFESAEFAGAELIDLLSRRPVGLDRAFGRPILVATDGSRASGAALRIAAALAARDGNRIEAIVVEGTRSSLPGICIGARALRQEYIAQSTRLGRVRRQLCTILEGDSWRLRVESGRVGPTILRAARASRASLILMGMNRHGPVRHLLGGGAIAHVLQSAQIPVLAVSAPRRGISASAPR